MGKGQVTKQKIKPINVKKQTINFVSKPKRQPYVKKFGLLVLILIIVGVGGFIHFSWMGDIKDSEESLQDVQNFINSRETQQAYKEALAMEALEETLNQELVQMVGIETVFNDVYMVSESLVDTLNYNVPQGVFLTKLSFQEGNFNLTGYSTSHESVGQFAYNLRYSTLFDGIVIQSIQNVDENFQFVINGLWIKEAVNASY
jgi:Tfp pilus assembly protein PilN